MYVIILPEPVDIFMNPAEGLETIANKITRLRVDIEVPLRSCRAPRLYLEIDHVFSPAALPGNVLRGGA